MKTIGVLLLVAAAGVPVLAFQDPKPEPAKESRTAWLRRVYASDRCTFGDGARGIYNLVHGKHAEQPFAELARDLVTETVIDSAWSPAETDKLTKGQVAYMLCRALKIEGGAILRLTGPSRRYCLRECLHLGLLSQGVTDEYVSGRELIDILQKADVFKKEGSLNSLRNP